MVACSLVVDDIGVVVMRCSDSDGEKLLLKHVLRKISVVPRIV